MANFKNQSRYMYGTETVSFRVVDSATAADVEFALFGPINRQKLAWLSTLGIENATQSIKLDQAQLGVGVIPERGSRIDRTSDGSSWRVEAVDFSHVTAVHLCYCSQINA